MFGLENWGLLGLFLGNLLAATVVPFSSDALYIAVLSVMKRPLECFVVATAGNWLGSVITYYMGRGLRNGLRSNAKPFRNRKRRWTNMESGLR